MEVLRKFWTIILNIPNIILFYIKRPRYLYEARESKVNQLSHQKEHWENMLQNIRKKIPNINGQFKDDLRWGKIGNPLFTTKPQPEEYKKICLKIKERVVSYINPEITVLELGAWDGAWTRYLVQAKQIICVDLFDLSFEQIKKRFNNSAHIEFYRTKGYELHGIMGESIDFIFAMDAVMRTEKKYIEMYFQEFNRVLKSKGVLYISLPCTKKILSVKKRFTPLTINDIKLLCENNFSQYQIDKKTIWHGVMVEAIK